MTHHMMHSPHKADAGSAAALAFLAGAAAGIAAGLLFAPKRGEETRQQVRDKVQQAREKAMDKMNHQKDAAKEQMHEISDRAQEVAEESKDSIKEAQARVRRAAAKNTGEEQ